MDAIAIRYTDWESPCDKRGLFGHHRTADDDIAERWRGVVAMQAVHPYAYHRKWVGRPLPHEVARRRAASVAQQTSSIESLQQRFYEQATKWESQTAFMSATPMRVLHDSYQSIMAMGPDVVPILLRDLQKTQRHWFWALRHLTNADPVPEKDRGNVNKMIAAWVEWGRREGKV